MKGDNDLLVGVPKGFTLGNSFSSTVCWDFEWLRWFTFSENRTVLAINMRDFGLHFYLHKSCRAFKRLEKLMAEGERRRSQIESLCFSLARMAHGPSFYSKIVEAALEIGRLKGTEEIRSGLKTLLGLHKVAH